MRHNGAWIAWLGGLELMVVGCASTPTISPVPGGAAGSQSSAITPRIASTAASERFRDVLIEREETFGAIKLKIPLRKDEHPFLQGVKNDPNRLRFDSRIEPDGMWSTLEIREEGGEPRLGLVNIPAEYPNGSTLRLRLRNGTETSEALLEGLPGTRGQFDLAGQSNERFEPVPGVTLDAVAFHPRPRRTDDLPVVGILLRASVPQGPGTLWRLNNVGFETPFVASGYRSPGSGRVLRYALNGTESTFMEELSTPFADGFPRVGIRGYLQRCETRKETVDFGIVPTVVRGKTTYLSPKADVSRTLSDGRVVTLYVRDSKEAYGRNEPWTVAALAIEGGDPWPGEDENVAVQVDSARSNWSEVRPDGGRSQITFYSTPPKGSLRLTVTRIRSAESYPIDLNPTVRKVSFPALSTNVSVRGAYLGPADSPRLALLPKH